MDDVRAVMEAAGCPKAALMSSGGGPGVGRAGNLDLLVVMLKTILNRSPSRIRVHPARFP